MTKEKNNTFVLQSNRYIKYLEIATCFFNHQSKNPMTRKILLLFVCLFTISLSTVFSQNNSEYSGLAIDATPKHQSEIGIHAGHFMVIGDILPRPSWGAGIHFRRAFDYAFAWRIDAQYGQALGLEPRNSGGSSTSPAGGANRVLSGALNNGLDYTSTPWYHNYKTKYMSLSIQGIWSLNSFNFKKQIRKVNWYVYGGVGADRYESFYDAKGSNGEQHDFSRVADGLSTENSREDRREAADRVKDILDGDYETRAETALGRRSEGDDDNIELQINGHADAGVGVSFKLNDRINLSLDHKATIVFGNEGDLLDGYRHRSVFDLTQYRDMINYTSVRLNFNLGKREERSEPLWWVSPLGLISEDLAEVKSRPIFDKTDADKDGVFDIVDDEKDTPEGCPVNTRGVRLDSDMDGVFDCDDKEPYTPPTLVGTIDDQGVGQAPPPPVYTKEEDVNRIVDAKLKGFEATIPDAATDWFLPIINFDLDKYNIRGSEYGKMHQVASVMKRYPALRVLVSGHTDLTAGDCYNQLLSYNRAETAINYLVNKYGISRDRLVLNWGGETTPLVDTGNVNLWNRRVEFTIAEGQSDKGKPDCGTTRAGSGSGSSYSGNKEAGY